MNGDFRITLDYLKEIGACRDGQGEFKRVFPDGARYQETLDRCAQEGRLDFASWLLDKLGPSDDVRTYDGEVNDPDKIIVFAGNLKFATSVSAKHIIAGRGIEAGWGIEAGEGYGIYAGLNIKIDSWDKFAVVLANSRPQNLVSGYWSEKTCED